MTKAILIIMMFGKYGSGVSVTPFESMPTNGSTKF